MKHLLFRKFLLIALFVGIGNILLCNAQNETLTYYGKMTSYANGMTTNGTIFNSIQITYDGDTPISVRRGACTWGLSFEAYEEDCNVYSADENSNFYFKIYDNKKIVAELYIFGGNLYTTAFYDRKPSSRRNSGSSGSFGGTFTIPDNSGSSSSSGSTYRTCPSCGGSGTCSSCHGSGGEWRDTGYYTGSGSRSWISCPSCSGSKRCFNCHGSGRI